MATPAPPARRTSRKDSPLRKLSTQPSASPRTASSTWPGSIASASFAASACGIRSLPPRVETLVAAAEDAECVLVLGADEGEEIQRRLLLDFQPHLGGIGHVEQFAQRQPFTPLRSNHWAMLSASSLARNFGLWSV